MKRTIVNFLIDTVAFITFVYLIATGIIMHYLLPAGSGHFVTLWGLDRHQWGSIHFWISIVFLGTLAIHLALHWKWIVCVIKGRPKEGSGVRLGLAVTGVFALLSIVIAPLLSDTRQVADPPHRLQSSTPANVEIPEVSGSMSLWEVEQRTGVSLETILSGLNLPRDIPANERLGRLRRVYGFEMEEVKKLIEHSISENEF